jgi:hypothetical protein
VTYGLDALAAAKDPERLRVDLLNTAETAELALDPVEIAMVIAARRAERRSSPAIPHRHLLDDVHRKRQLGNPRSACAAVGDIELGRGGVLHERFGAKVVHYPD